MSALYANTPVSHELSLPRAGARIGVLARAVAVLLDWQTRAAQRAQLASLDDHMLKDMGLDRAQASREAEKPFWRA